MRKLMMIAGLAVAMTGCSNTQVSSEYAEDLFRDIPETRGPQVTTNLTAVPNIVTKEFTWTVGESNPAIVNSPDLLVAVRDRVMVVRVSYSEDMKETLEYNVFKGSEIQLRGIKIKVTGVNLEENSINFTAPQYEHN